MRLLVPLAAAVIAVSICGPAIAEPVVKKTIGIADERAALLRPEHPKASVILIPGGDGPVEIGYDGAIRNMRNDLLVRTRFDYVEHGLAVLVVDTKVDLKLAIDVMRRVEPPVTVIAASRGTLRAAEGLAEGAHPDALVLVSGILTNESGHNANVAEILGTPDRLPPTLVIHHRQDECGFSRPAGVAPFIKWADGHARAVWLDGGHNGGDPCDGQAYHGFAGLDAQIVSVAAAFH
jgi:hypothetical protein